MRKMLFMVLSFFLILPISSAAVRGAIFGAADAGLNQNTLNGNSVSIVNNGTDTKIYLGMEIFEGSYSKYEATLKLSDSSFRYRSSVLASGWSGTITEDVNNKGTYYISLKSDKLLTVGRYLVVTIYLDGTGSSSDRCSITLSATREEVPICEFQNGNYYDNNGNIVSYPEYLKACTSERYYCEVKNGYYFDNNGNSVSQTEYQKSCFSCKVDGDKYYNKDGQLVSYPEYLKACTSEKYYCEVKNGYYFDNNGNSVSESEYQKSCFSCKIDGDKYYNKDGQLVDKDTYEKECHIDTNSCVSKDGKFYDKDGVEVSEETYKEVCYEKEESYKCLSENEIEHTYTTTHIITGNATYSTEVIKYGNASFEEILKKYPNVLEECKKNVDVPNDSNKPNESDDFENPQTGMDTSYYILIPIGILVAVVFYMKSRKNYFYKL